MSTTLARATYLTLALLVFCFATIHDQVTAASWLDASKPAGWNKAGMPVPAAPQPSGTVDPRCRSMARPAELEEDKSLHDKGWDLVGAYQGGWDIRVIQATASYEGMCRPRQYQVFVFMRGVFAGTLSPQPMDSRADGALSRVILQSNSRLSAEYLRYATNDALCCPSKTTHVEFEITRDPGVVQPVSISTSAKR
jgi:hypothetical protein